MQKIVIKAELHASVVIDLVKHFQAAGFSVTATQTGNRWEISAELERNYVSVSDWTGQECE